MQRAKIASPAREQIRPLLQSLPGGTLPFLDAVRQIAQVSTQHDALRDDPDFLLFCAIESETGHLPASTARAMCSPDWIQACDQEIESVRRFYGAQIAAACGRLLARCRP
jgi:hypothetical protein